MNKTKLLRVTLILIPLCVVLLAVNPTSVTVIGENEITQVSFMNLVEGSYLGICAPVAALLNYIVFGEAVLYLMNKKEFWLKGIIGLAFASMTLVVLPVIVNSVPKIIPNVLVAILLGVQCIAANLLRKSAPEKTETKNTTLRKH